MTILTLTPVAGLTEWLAGMAWALALNAKMQSISNANPVLSRLIRSLRTVLFFAMFVPLKNRCEVKERPANWTFLNSYTLFCANLEEAGSDAAVPE